MGKNGDIPDNFRFLSERVIGIVILNETNEFVEQIYLLNCSPINCEIG